MPKGPKGQKRPADVIANAVKVMRIATGEEDEALTEDGKDKAAPDLRMTVKRNPLASTKNAATSRLAHRQVTVWPLLY